MNAAQHLERAEALLARARTTVDDPGVTDALTLTVEAAGHALIALAIEAGAPHAAAPAGVTSGGQ